MFTYLEQNTNLKDINFAKECEFIQIKKNLKLKEEIDKQLKERH